MYDATSLNDWSSCVLRHDSQHVQDALSAYGFPEHKKQSVVDSIEFMEACQAFLDTACPTKAQEHGMCVQSSCISPFKHATNGRNTALRLIHASRWHVLTGKHADHNVQQGEAPQGR